MTVLVRTFDRADTEAVVALWHAAGLTRPWNDPYADIQRKLAVQPELFVVAADDDAIVGTAMGGYDGHRGQMYYVATDESRRGEGIARRLLQEVELRLLAMGCPKIHLMVREGNDAVIGLYEHLGYEPFGITNLGKRLIIEE